MTSPFARLSLRVKLTAAFVVIVVLSAAISTLLGNQIVTNAMQDVTQRRVHTGMETARLMVQGELDRVRRSVTLVSQAHRILLPLREHRPDQVPAMLDGLRSEHGLDFMAFVDNDSRRVFNATPGMPAAPPFLERAWAGETLASVEVMSRDELASHAPGLQDRARIRIVSVPRESPGTRPDLSSGLVLVAASPVRVDGNLVGVVYGGILLNGTSDLVDRIRQGVFGGETHEGAEVGTASIFLDDVRVSTNVLRESGERALGSRSAADVAGAVLGRGEEWHGRAFVVHAWNVTSYQPIRDHAGRVIGMLYVGMREEPYLAVRTNMMLSFLIVVVAGSVIVMGFTYLITTQMIYPLEELVTASRQVAAGDLSHRVAVSSADEIGHLATSFNQMLASLENMRSQLEDSAHTLEERVQQRTAELAAVQAQMAQAERLASLGRMAAGVAHEINNPLGGILTFAALAQEDTPEDHPLRRNVDIIVKQTLRCRDIVRGLLDFARQSDTLATLTDVNALVTSTLPLLDQQPAFHNIHIVREFDSGLPPVLIDRGQLQQVVINLALNAVDAMEQAGTLTLRTRHDRPASRVLLEVADEGKGIPPEVLPLIFEPFFTTKDVGKGTGLGLSIVHGIVTRAGGSIDVRSSPEGTTFTVALPAPESEGKEERGAVPGTDA